MTCSKKCSSPFSISLCDSLTTFQYLIQPTKPNKIKEKKEKRERKKMPNQSLELRSNQTHQQK
jgi:hypothetical protein